jgi:hypothetical protein
MKHKVIAKAIKDDSYYKKKPSTVRQLGHIPAAIRVR